MHVSVVLPYHNREDTVLEAAQSVLAQTHGALTLHLIDDGSTDRSSDVLHGLDDPRIVRTALNGNRGVSAARNAGLDLSTDLVAFMDSDDVWLPEKLEKQLELFASVRDRIPPVSVIGCGWAVHPGGRPIQGFSTGPHSRRDVLRGAVRGISTQALLVDRSVAATEARFDEQLPALVDRDYVIGCLSNGTTVMVVPEQLVLVRRGRSDHVATSRRAAAAYEVLMDKYATELAADPGLVSWYAFRACREHLRHGAVRRAWPHMGAALRRERWRRLLHIVLGALARETGLALAQRITLARPSTTTGDQAYG